MVDRKGNRLNVGSRVKFYVGSSPLAQERHGGPTRKGTILHDHAIGSMLDIVLDGDPFGTYVEFSRVEVIPGETDENHPLLIARSKNMRVRSTSNQQGQGDPEGGSTQVPTASKPNTRELRKQAKSLGIEGWEDMSARALQAAVEKAEDSETPEPTKARRSSKATKVPATKVSKTTAKSTKASSNGTKAKASAEVEVAENGNPYKPGSNLWHITEQIIKGGKRAKMVAQLKKKIELKPRNASDDWDEDYELDRRVLITGQILKRDHGWTVERGGRGAEDGTIVGTPPD